jgi:hypothetical protein
VPCVPGLDLEALLLGVPAAQALDVAAGDRLREALTAYRRSWRLSQG